MDDETNGLLAALRDELSQQRQVQSELLDAVKELTEAVKDHKVEISDLAMHLRQTR